jgi:pentatricopeptide repeat protein
VWGPRRCKPNAWAFRTIARICREAGLLREALNAYSGMRRVGLKPSNAEWRELIAAAADAALAEPRGGGLVQQVRGARP